MDPIDFAVFMCASLILHIKMMNCGICNSFSISGCLEKDIFFTYSILQSMLNITSSRFHHILGSVFVQVWISISHVFMSITTTFSLLPAPSHEESTSFVQTWISSSQGSSLPNLVSFGQKFYRKLYVNGRDTYSSLARWVIRKDNCWETWIGNIVYFYFLFCLYRHCCWRSNYQEGKGWGPINPFNPVIFLCMSHTRILDFQHHIFMLNELRSEVIACFVDIVGIAEYHCLNQS